MISEVVMPQMGADMTEGTVLRWLKEEGEQVARGEIIAEIETDKANVEIEAFESGVFRKALAEEGDVVQVGEVIAVIAGAEDDISQYGNGAAPARESKGASTAAAPRDPTASAKAQTPDEAPRDVAPSESPVTSTEMPESGAPPTAPAPTERHEAQRAAIEAPASREDGRVRASPLAKRIAEERGVDLSRVSGSGPGGRIVKKDVEQAPVNGAREERLAPAKAAKPSANDTTEGVEMSRMRQAIARNMSQSKREAPHYYLLVDVDMTDAMALRKQINEIVGEDQRVSVNDLIVRACALALQRHPMFNVTARDDRFERHEAQNVCIAIALEAGLIAPAIVDAGRKSLVEIARDAKDLVGRAKGGSLKSDEITAGTFTITNLGGYGIETLIGIIQPPQTSILGIGSVMPQPAARGGDVVVRDVMKLALSADHRVTDGAQGAQFLGEIKSLLEKPVSLLL